MKILFLSLFISFSLQGSEKKFVKFASKNCAKVIGEKERNLCMTGSFVAFCQIKGNQTFCKKEAAKADYSKRSAGAKIGLKKIYKALIRSKKKTGSYALDLAKVYPPGNKDSYFYIFGAPKACTSFLKKGSPTNTAKLHGIYERTTFAEAGILKTLNKFKCPKKGEFRIYSIGQIDSDLTFDIWYVDSKKRIKHFRSDYKR